MQQPLIVLRHPVHGAIEELEAKSALSASDQLLFTRSVSLDAVCVSREQTANFDWVAAQRTLVTEYDASVDPLVRSGARLAYFGFAPIPLVMQLGYLLEEWPRVDVFQRRHRGEPLSWAWTSTVQTVQVRVEHSHPVMDMSAEGDVIVRVSSSHAVDREASRSVLPSGALLEIDVSISAPDLDAINSPADLKAIADLFREQLDVVSVAMPRSRIHLFAAVPVGLALELGRAVSPTKHRPVQTYQYHARESPSYRPAFVLQDARSAESAPLSETEIARANDALVAWREELEQLATLGRDAIEQRELWREAAQKGPWGSLPNLSRVKRVFTDVLVDAATAEFSFDRGRRVWALSAGLVLAFQDAIADEQRRRLAIRLFFQHEALHHEWHGLTGAMSVGVGRLPRVLEEMDYQADVWAMIHELSRFRRSQGEKLSVEFAQQMVESAIETFWAFDRGTGPMREIQVRRLNRYLIWYWQALHLETVDSVGEVFAVLARKPTLEIAGLQPEVSGQRVVYRLDRLPAYLEVGVFADDTIERRSDGGAYAVRQIVDGFRQRDPRAIKEALRGVFDSVHASAQRRALEL